MNRIFTVLLLLFCVNGFSQTIPPERIVDWTLAGLRDTTTAGFRAIDMDAQGVVGDGITSNDSILDHVFSAVADSGAILNFPSGNFLFNHTINVPDNIIIKGQGADVTTFTMDLGGSGHAFRIQGQSGKSLTTSIVEYAAKDSSSVVVSQPEGFSIGDWVQIIQDDADLVTSSWAQHTVGQILQIRSIFNNRIILESPLRMNYDTDRLPYITKIIPAKNVGIECLKIHRLDNTAPEQSSNVYFYRAVNCWINNIESENCTFSHVKADLSSNLNISGSYFHHGFDYGGGGRAYGVMLQTTSNECLVENNTFEHLRHSMILQSGANGNVFAYNYSLDPYWSTLPNNSAGDMVLHGNYTYANLFEQNIGQNIVIDNSHGPNGPYNTFFRNRASGYGIFFSAPNSPYQNLVGNEIPNTAFPYSLVNYTIQGIGHFLYGNNNKGNIHPSGTNTLNDATYAYAERPDFVPVAQWAGIGTPNTMNSASIPAYDRYHSGSIFNNSCDDLTVSTGPDFETAEGVLIYPNPVTSEMTIESSHFIKNLTIINLLGQMVSIHTGSGFAYRINTSDWSNGIYLILIDFIDRESTTVPIVKTRSF